MRRITALLVPVILLSGLTGRASATVDTLDAARIRVSPHAVMVDEPFRIAVAGVPPRSLVELQLTLRRGDSTTWVSHATFQADARGRVGVTSDAPVAGDYERVDAMGLLWSARLTALTPNPDVEMWTDKVHLTASVGGQVVASKDLVRRYLRHGTRVTDVRHAGLVGTLIEPPPRGRRPTVIVVGGSEGGMATALVSGALLSTHRFNVLALAYFAGPLAQGLGLPTELSRIPLEYFTTAIDWLRSRRTVDADRLGIVGASRGGELALLLGSRHPDLKAVVAYAPSSVVWPGLSGPQNPAPLFDSAWTENGQPVSFLPYNFNPADTRGFYANVFDDTAARDNATIPVDRINGPVLLVTGDDDQLWPSPLMADQIMARLRASAHPFADQHLDYPGAGHVISAPFQPTTLPSALPLGGNPRDSARAGRDHWPRLVTFLTRAL